MSWRSAWATQGVPSHPGLESETVSKMQNKHFESLTTLDTFFTRNLSQTP